MLGREQEAWLSRQLAGSGAVWNVLAQQVLVGSLPLAGGEFPMDKWDGAPAARERLLDELKTRAVANPVVLTGDNHNNWVFDLRRRNGDLVGTEFAGTSVTSNSDGAEISEEYRSAVGAPHIRWHNSQRGYVVCEITPKLWTTHFRVTPVVTRPGGNVITKASFVVEAGRPGAARI